MSCEAKTKSGLPCKGKGNPYCPLHMRLMKQKDALCGCSGKKVKGGLGGSFNFSKLDNLQQDYVKGLYNYGKDIVRSTKPIYDVGKSLGIIPNDPRVNIAAKLIYGEGSKRKVGRPKKVKGGAVDNSEVNAFIKAFDTYGNQFTPQQYADIFEKRAQVKGLVRPDFGFKVQGMEAARPALPTMGEMGAGLKKAKKKSTQHKGKVKGGVIMPPSDTEEARKWLKKFSNWVITYTEDSFTGFQKLGIPQSEENKIASFVEGETNEVPDIYLKLHPLYDHYVSRKVQKRKGGKISGGLILSPEATKEAREWLHKFRLFLFQNYSDPVTGFAAVGVDPREDIIIETFIDGEHNEIPDSYFRLRAKFDPYINDKLKFRRGAGIKDIFKKGFKFVKSIPYRLKAIYQFGPRGNEPTGRFNEYMAKNKDKKIVSIDVGRTPLSKGVSTAMNILSGGKFSSKAKQLEYDDVYHQYMIVKYDDGSIEKIEKNHVVENSKPTRQDLDNIKVTIPVADKNLTLPQLMKNASYEDSSFWKYDPAKKNCQLFVRDVVDRNGLLPQIDTTSILQTQEADKLIDTIPAPLRGIPLVTTNLASGIDKIIYGEGLPQNQVLKARLIINGMI